MASEIGLRLLFCYYLLNNLLNYCSFLFLFFRRFVISRLKPCLLVESKYGVFAV